MATASVKLLGKKREKLIAPQFEQDSKEESTQSSNPGIPSYTNFSFHNIIEGLFDIWEEKEKKTIPKIKLGDEKFKIKRYFNLPSKKEEKKIPTKRKVITINELDKNIDEYRYHFLLMKNYSINELKEINLLNNISPKKFHMILDIDSTMIKALDKTDKPLISKPDDFEISGSLKEGSLFEFYCRYRPFLFHFIHELKDYFNFYISTLGRTNYAKEIIKDLTQKAGISIPDINVVSNDTLAQKMFKSIKEIKPLANFKDEQDNTVIIDDIVNYWIKPYNVAISDEEITQSIKCLIPCKRYVIDSAKGQDLEKFGILLHNNIKEESYKKELNYSIYVDYSLCIEKDEDSENGKKGQFFYLEIFVEKCIKFCLYTGKSMVDAMNFLRNKIFENCKFNLRYLDNDWNYVITPIIGELGGEIVVNPDETTHFIVKDEIKREKISSLKNNQYVININYIFQCYFNLFRMNEAENQAFSKEKKVK